MNESGRQTQLIVLLGISPAALLLLTIWLYGSLVEGMRTNLHDQRALALRTMPADGGGGNTKPYSWAILNSDMKQFVKSSADWPKHFDSEMISRFRTSLASGTEHGVEVDQGASGTAILWIVSVDGGIRAALQSRRTFYAKLESLQALIWTAGLILAGGAFVVFTTMARKLSDVFNDMETKNLELERANRNLEELGTLKSNFLALVSHELRTPLARLSGHIQLMKKAQSELSPEINHRIDEMSVEIGELSRMTSNVLDLTRLQSEDLSARMSIGQIESLVRSSVERITRSALLRGLKIEIDTPETPPVHHDPYLLERILDNLLTNAVKYASDQGKLIVRLKEDESFVQIQIENSGQIIQQGEREKIFEKFYRISQETDVPGTGLGLYLVRQFILMMGGRAWVEPLSDGNRFVVTLPLG